MANTLKLGEGTWGTKEGSLLAYNDENRNYKPLPFDFTRAGTATVVNRSGLIETVQSGIPRIDFSDDANGALLLEPQSTNLITYSEAFDNAYWTKNGTSVVSGFTSPSGDSPLGAFKLVESALNERHRLRLSSSISVSNSTAYSQSIFVKSEGRTKVAIKDNVSSSKYASFNLTTGSLIDSSGSSFSIEAISGGFYKISNTYTTIGTTAGLEISILNDSYVGGDPINNTYQGDGSSGVYIYGAQLETSYPTSYIPTQGSTVTRNPETCSGAGDVNTFNDSEGVLYAEFSALSNDGTFRILSLSNGTTSNEVKIQLSSTDNTIGFGVVAGGIPQTDQFYTIADTLSNNKIAAKYKENDFALWVNGIEVLTDASGIIPTGLSTLNFERGTGSNPFYGKTKDLRVYNTALTDAELRSLTRL